MKPLKVYLDEGALDGKSRFPSACAVVVGDPEAAEERISAEATKLILSPDFRLEPGFDQFVAVGFHHVEDNVVAQQAFIRMLPRIDFEWWCSICVSSSDEDDPYDLLPSQFEWLVEKILLKYSDRQIEFVFEQNQRLSGEFGGLVERAVRASQAERSAVTFTIGSKQDRVLAVADYCISIAAAAIGVWKALCCDIDSISERYQYRSLAGIEPLCSVLYAADIGKSISTRSRRLAENSYYFVTGEHAIGAACAEA